ncbi:MAG: lysozyme, partial [Rhodocyclaceae bacterium]|nr:lysozyme [Rhodocyclaceae bacterium]
MSINYASPAAEPPQGGRSPLGGTEAKSQSAALAAEVGSREAATWKQVTDAQSAAGARVGAYLSPNPRLPWPICREAVELIARAEGLRLDAYQDVAGVWTIGRGHTGQDVRAGLRWSLDHADEVFLQDVTATAQAVSKLLEGCTQTPQAAGAMVSLAYNIGTA